MIYRILGVVLYAVVISGLDSWLYGIEHQRRNALPWLFNPMIRYRVLQKIFEIGGMLALFLIFHSWWIMAGILIAHACTVFDFLFYVWLRQMDYIKTKGIDPYWLRHPFQVGYFLFRPFSFGKFFVTFLFGTMAMIAITALLSGCGPSDRELRIKKSNEEIESISCITNEYELKRQGRVEVLDALVACDSLAKCSKKPYAFRATAIFDNNTQLGAGTLYQCCPGYGECIDIMAAPVELKECQHAVETIRKYSHLLPRNEFHGSTGNVSYPTLKKAPPNSIFKLHDGNGFWIQTEGENLAL